MKASEAIQRLLEPAYWASGAQNTALRIIDAVSPSAYGTRYRAVRPYTMLSNARLRSLHRAVELISRSGIAGDVVECGTARGGSAALMGLAMKDDPLARRLWVFDTFEGMPKPTADDPDYDLALQYEGSCRGGFEEVSAVFRQFGLAERTKMVKGLFQDTVAHASIDQFALLHLDGDWYESVKVCLDAFYDKVVPGGIIQIDDYGYWAGARKAVNEFMAARNIIAPLRRIDYTGRTLVTP